MTTVIVTSATLATAVLIAVLVLKSLNTTVQTLDRAHERWAVTLDQLLDRFMATDLDHYKLVRATESAPEGGQEFPEPARLKPRDSPQDLEPDEPVAWGTMSAMRTRLAEEPDELALADEESDEERRLRQHGELMARLNK
jgi:hypothetical protein